MEERYRSKIVVDLLLKRKKEIKKVNRNVEWKLHKVYIL